MQPKDYVRNKTERSKQELALPLQLTLPTFAQSFRTSSLPCFSFIGYQLCSNFAIYNMVFFMETGLRVGQFFFMDETWFHLSGYINSKNSRICSAENPQELHENPLHLSNSGVWCTES
jgi:hypothetical protein